MATFHVRSFAELRESLQRRHNETMRELHQSMVDAAESTRLVLMMDAVALEKVDTGLYASSFRVKSRTAGIQSAASFSGGWLNYDTGVAIVNDAPYAGIIEEGARPHFPNLGRIMEWVARKESMLGTGLRGHGTFSGAREARNVAYAICLAIARRGLPAYRIMRKRLPYAKAKFDEILRRRIATLNNRRT